MSSLARVGALVAAGTLVTTGLVSGLTSPAVAASNDPSPVQQAVSWLAGQSFYNAGSRIDFLQQLVLLGRTADATTQADAIKAAAVDYAKNAAADAKLVFAGDLVHEDANTWGAGDLVQAVANGVDDTTGQVTTPYSGPEVQALAVRALSALGGRTENAEYVKARDYLLTQQCSDGRFGGSLQAASCDASPEPGSADATALVVLYLGDSADSAVQASVDSARGWLRSAQQPDGSWQTDGSYGSPVSNSNSTGLAALAVGHGAESVKAAAWLRNVQIRDAGACTTAASKDEGAIAFTTADYAAARSNPAGLDEGAYTRGSWVYATQQSLAALEDAPDTGGSLQIAGSSDFVKGGSTLPLVVRNVAPESMGCLTGPGAKKTWTADSSGAATLNVTVPSVTSMSSYSVVDSAGRAASHTFRVLGPKVFGLSKARARVHRGRIERIIVRGLAPGEPIHVRYHGNVIRRGTATAAGTFVARFRVGRSLGVQRVVALGKFSDIRRGTTHFRVVR